MVCRCIQFNVCNGVAMYVYATAAVGSCAICWADLPLNWPAVEKWELCAQDVPYVIQLACPVKVLKTTRVPHNGIGIGSSNFIRCPSDVLPVCKLNSCLWFANFYRHALDRAARLLYVKQLPVSSLSLKSQMFMCFKSVCIWTSGRRISFGENCLWRSQWHNFMSALSHPVGMSLFKPSGARLVWSSFNEGSDKGKDERALMRLIPWLEPALGLLLLVTLATDPLSATHGMCMPRSTVALRISC